MLAVIALVVIGIKTRKEKEQFLNKEAVLPLRGIAAIYIVLAHIHMFCEFNRGFVVLKPFNDAVILFKGKGISLKTKSFIENAFVLYCLLV